MIAINFKQPRHQSLEDYLNYGVFSQWNTIQLLKGTLIFCA